jgi:hypothetical protein
MARTFLLYHNGRVDEVLDDGGLVVWDTDPTLFENLVHAGYPLHHDDEIGGLISLGVEDDKTVAAHTSGPEPREHDLGPAGELFLRWLRDNDPPAEAGDR